MTPGEIPSNWRQCPPPLSKYAVDDEGRIWNMKRRRIKKDQPHSRKLVPSDNPFDDDEYVDSPRRTVQLSLDAKGTGRQNLVKHQVAKVVLLAWRGEPPQAGWQASHLNGNPEDCRPCNLRWEPQQKNIARYNETTKTTGSRNARAKLTNDDILYIFELHHYYCLEQQHIARKLNVSIATISRVLNRKTYTNVPVPSQDEYRARIAAEWQAGRHPHDTLHTYIAAQQKRRNGR